MIWDEATNDDHTAETFGQEKKQKLDYQRSKEFNVASKRRRSRQGTSRKVACGMAARRNKRWNW